VTACCLVVLVLSPFTAPFRTCDLAALFGGPPPQHRPIGRPGPAELTIDNSVVNVPALARAGRVRLLEVSATAGGSSAPVQQMALHTRTTALSYDVRGRLVFATILRV